MTRNDHHAKGRDHCHRQERINALKLITQSVRQIG